MFKIKLIMLFLGFSIISSVSLAADTTKVTPSVVYNDVKSLGPKIESAIGVLGKELKVGAHKVWDILIKQQLVWSYCYLFTTICSLISLAHFCYRYKLGNEAHKLLLENYYKQERFSNYSKPDWHDSHVTMCIITGVIAFILTLISSLFFGDMLTGFINPEYGAMKTIAEIATQIK